MIRKKMEYEKNVNRILVLLCLCSIVLCVFVSAVMAQTYPMVKPEGSSNRLSSMARVRVEHFQVEGNTVISAQELAKITAPYEKREITSEEMQQLRRELTLYYVNKGYITSGVVIPDQKASNGIIVLDVVEGKLTGIEIEGNKYLRTSYISKRLMPHKNWVVNVHKLQQALLILEQNPRIKRINAELEPGVRVGESTLKVKVEENLPYKAGVEINNASPPSVGGIQGEVFLAHQSVTGNGDTLAAHLGVTEGLINYDFSYAFPVTARDTTVRLHYRKNESTVIESAFKDLNIESRTETFGMTVSHPLYRQGGREFSLGLTGEYRRSEDFLLGEPFSFSEGEQEGRTNISVLRFLQDYIDRDLKQVIAVRSTFSFGIDAFGATMNPSGPTGKFTAWQGQAQWIRRLTESDWQSVLRTSVQLTPNRLLVPEQFSVGGMESVRGYRENRLVRDNGIASSIELRVPVFRNKQGESIVQLCPFFDTGAAWSTGGDTTDPDSISSAGLGLRWAISSKINFQIYGGIPFRVFKNSNDLQDKGVHFRLSGYAF